MCFIIVGRSTVVRKRHCHSSIANKLDGAGGSYYTMAIESTPNSPHILPIKSDYDAQSRLRRTRGRSWSRWWRFRTRAGSCHDISKRCSKPGLRKNCYRHIAGGTRRPAMAQRPGRRWYRDQRGETPGSQEVVLIHRKRAAQLRGLTDEIAQVDFFFGKIAKGLDHREMIGATARVNWAARLKISSSSFFSRVDIFSLCLHFATPCCLSSCSRAIPISTTPISYCFLTAAAGSLVKLRARSAGPCCPD